MIYNPKRRKGIDYTVNCIILIIAILCVCTMLLNENFFNRNDDIIVIDKSSSVKFLSSIKKDYNYSNKEVFGLDSLKEYHNKAYLEKEHKIKYKLFESLIYKCLGTIDNNCNCEIVFILIQSLRSLAIIDYENKQFEKCYVNNNYVIEISDELLEKLDIEYFSENILSSSEINEIENYILQAEFDITSMNYNNLINSCDEEEVKDSFLKILSRTSDSDNLYLANKLQMYLESSLALYELLEKEIYLDYAIEEFDSNKDKIVNIEKCNLVMGKIYENKLNLLQKNDLNMDIYLKLALSFYSKSNDENALQYFENLEKKYK